MAKMKRQLQHKFGAKIISPASIKNQVDETKIFP